MADDPNLPPRPPPVAQRQPTSVTPPPASRVPPAKGPPPVAGRDAAAFTVELVLGALQGGGLIDEAQRREVLSREHQHRGRILGGQGGKVPKGPKYVVSPIELVAAVGLPDPTRAGVTLDQDRITAVVAQQLQLATRKIDPLKLDAGLITRTVSRAYARTHSCLPLALDAGVLELAVANPWQRELFEQLRMLVQAEIRPVLCSKADILQSITDVYGFQRSVTAAVSDQGGPKAAGASDVGNLEQLVELSDHETLEADDRPVVNAVEYLLHYAFDQRASDIHIEPRRDACRIRMRIDGVLHDVYQVPKAVHAPLVARLKLLARMDIAEKRRPQDGRIKTSRAGREVELRVSTVPVAFGEKVVARVFDPDVVLQNLEDLGFFPEEMQTFSRWIDRPHGLVLVTGPTGSGKTTTLYSALKILTTPDVNVTTIEDPVEMVFDGFNQISVQPGIDLTFANALRHVLRQDPDIVMVGEIRDGETATNAVQAALTGHLVLSTLHTNDAPSAVGRMRDLGVPSFLLAGTLLGVMAQRLVRTVCVHCAEDVPMTPAELVSIGAPEGGAAMARRGPGCPKCRGTGYRGRTGVFELFDCTGPVSQAISDGVGPIELMALARERGMKSLREHGQRKVLEGVTTPEELVKATIEQ